MYTTIDNLQIYYQKVGKGKDLIMLHGWGQDVSTFWSSVELLSKNFTLWLVDLPGFGRSDIPSTPFDTKDYSKIMAEFIKKNSIKKPNLLGHSFGGKVSVKLASENPDLINKLVIVGSSGIKPDFSIKRSLMYPFAKVFHYLLPDVFNIKSLIRKKFYRKIESDYIDAGVMKESLLKTLKEDLTSELSEIENQTLIIWGDEDKAVPLKYGIRMYQKIKNAKIVVLEGLGHFLHVHNPKLFSYYVKDFLN